MAAPAFPYPPDHWLGQPSDNPKNHSGCYGGVDNTNVKTWQRQMAKRGWKLTTDGCYGPESEQACRDFQAKHKLGADGDVGPKTWNATWNAPMVSGGSSGGSAGGSAAAVKGWRNQVAHWHDNHLGLTESPAGSNCDNRRDGIRHAQDTCANGTWLRNQAWCGVWAFMGLHAAGLVKPGSHSWMASVSAIEDHARQGKAPFRAWTTDGAKAKKGDLVVLFGRGVHVGTVRSIDSGYAHTWEGNTSSGGGGSQSNGGGSFKRSRSRSRETYGYALVRDP